VACDENGLASFERIRCREHDGDVFLYAFDLIELNGDDLRRDPLQVRKATLASILAKARPGIRFNEHIEGDGPTVFAHACRLGLEGIVSKPKDSAYRSGHSPDWLKIAPPPPHAFFANLHTIFWFQSSQCHHGVLSRALNTNWEEKLLIQFVRKRRCHTPT
jgi:hypothetical protein